ncbi:MAG: glycoside hydrolase family 2 [Chitinophagaceae bacterium]|nr:MAG: glycoside hydrolase family 2 [Chitinophagaceae bacterium]
MRCLFVIAVVFFMVYGCSPGKLYAPVVVNDPEPLWLDTFRSPGSMQLSVYWYWISDNISKEGVEKDLEAMKRVGINRAFMSNIDGGGPVGKVRIFSDEWWSILHAALKKATELDIEIGLFNSPGWSQSGGPWISADRSMRYLASVDTVVNGPLLFQSKLPAIDTPFQDYKVLAFPAGKNKSAGTVLFADKREKQPLVVSVPVTGNKPMRSLVMKADHTINTTAKLYYEKDGQYVFVRTIEFDRSNLQLNVGFDPLAPVVISLPGVVTKGYRIEFAEPGQAKIRIAVSSQPMVERFPEKTLAKMFQTPLPFWDSYTWGPQPVVDDSSLLVPPTAVKDLTAESRDGLLRWNVPAGEWTIRRMVMRSTGVTNGPTTPEGTGLEVDKLNRDHVSYHFNSFIGEILKRIPAADRRSFRVVVADSYETGGQNWTDDMQPRFIRQYGYDPVPFLPAVHGIVVGSQDMSDRFLRDLRQLVSDRVAYDYVGGLRDEAHKHGLTTWLENYGHWGFPSEFLKYGGQSDEIGGEFWNEGTLGNIECRAASSAAHIYGKTQVSAESFTSGGAPFHRVPSMLKKRGDWSFTEGINKTLLHVYIQQPDERTPGMNAWFGTEFNRHNTWFEMGKAYFDYLKRCNFLLQQGKPVNDVAYFIGEDAPIMTGVTEPALPAGFQFDYINAEVLLRRLTVRDGRLVLPDGMSYRVLVIPPVKSMSPEVLEKIDSLVNAGAIVYGNPPKLAPGLAGYPGSQQRLQALARGLWGDVDGVKIKSRQVGKGQIVSGASMDELLALAGLVPDFNRHTNAPILYTHRKTARDEYYFVSNQSDSVVRFTPCFRDGKGQPWLLDATTGTRRKLPGYTAGADGISVNLKLEKNESYFIVFDKEVEPVYSGADNFPEPAKTEELKTTWTVQFDAVRRGPATPVTFSQLTDWSLHNNDSIKYYSGKAVYRARVYISSVPTGSPVLRFAPVNGMALIKLNGVELGTIWTEPYRMSTGTLLKKGWNDLEIEVVNTWENRLIGDKKLPEAQRGTYVANASVGDGQALSPSGLTGNIVLEIYPLVK